MLFRSKEGAEIIYGHHAKTKDELVEMVEQEEWDKLLQRVRVKPGDFFFVPSGTVHAIGEGILILETQQNSDTTYRLYDYNRRDSEGNLRELHLDKSMEVIETPFVSSQQVVQYEEIEDLCVTKFIECSYFSVNKWNLDGVVNLTQKSPFLLLSVIDGEGELMHGNETYRFEEGDHFILPSNFGEYKIVGRAEVIVASV